MFKIKRLLIRFCIIYSIIFFVVSLWYLSKLETSDESNSEPTHRLAVIVPYRDRSEELRIFLPYMNLFLKSQSIDHVFVIVNQIDKHRFNRAALINIGFIESRSFADYIVMHDVDLLPLNQKGLPYKYPKLGPVHIASPQYHPIYHYPSYVGGILIVSSKDFERVNGMLPLYWGWGREDDNFYVRLKLAGLNIYRPANLSTNQSNTFQHIHDKDVRRRDMKWYGEQKQEGSKLRPEQGLNTTKYEVVKREKKKTDQGIEYIMLDVAIECNYDLTPWCDHPNQIRE